MACRNLHTADDINVREKQWREDNIRAATRKHEEAAEELNAARVLMERYFDALRRKKGKPIIVCVVDSNNGYGNTYGYLEAWCTPETAKSFDHKDEYSGHSSSDSSQTMSEMIDKQIWAKSLGEFEDSLKPHDVLIHGTRSNY